MLDSLYTWTKDDAVRDILSLYEQQHWGIVSFLYFANVMHYRLLEPRSRQTFLYTNYKTALQGANFLFPDGIALQAFYYRGARWRRRLHNLNGTDFIPYFLTQLRTLTASIHVWIYTVYDPHIGKGKEELQKAITFIEDEIGIEVSWSQQSLYVERWQDVDWSSYVASLEHTDFTYRVLLVCTGTPHQEIWVEQHRAFFQQHRILVFNAWGLLDYLSGFEVRAPRWVVRMRVGETLRRVVQHPQKNIKKLWRMFGIIRYWWWRLVSRH